jgi:hypothetical protein
MPQHDRRRPPARRDRQEAAEHVQIETHAVPGA